MVITFIGEAILGWQKLRGNKTQNKPVSELKEPEAINVKPEKDNHIPVISDNDKKGVSSAEKGGTISNEKESWNRFWGLIITILGTFFTAYTIAKDYVEMEPGAFYKVRTVATILWFVLMSLLLLFGFLIFKLFRRLKVF